MLAERGRLVLSVPLLEWFEAAAHPRSVEVVPVTPAIAAEVAALPATFHRDPADRLIVATCRVLGAPLLTHDLCDHTQPPGLALEAGTRLRRRLRRGKRNLCYGRCRA